MTRRELEEELAAARQRIVRLEETIQRVRAIVADPMSGGRRIALILAAANAGLADAEPEEVEP